MSDYAKRLYDKAHRVGLTRLEPDELRLVFAIIRERAEVRRIAEAVLRGPVPSQGPYR
jgi:hypothetical protein